MKRTLIYMMAAITLLISSCQNDGHIGPLFGTWRVDSYTRDGVEVTMDYATTFSFQNNIVEVNRLLDNLGDYTRGTGTWSEDGNYLILDFTHYDSDTPAGTGIYSAPSWLGMTSSEVMKMVRIIDGRNMTWTWTAPDGAVCVYHLHKTW